MKDTLVDNSGVTFRFMFAFSQNVGTSENEENTPNCLITRATFSTLPLTAYTVMIGNNTRSEGWSGKWWDVNWEGGGNKPRRGCVRREQKVIDECMH